MPDPRMTTLPGPVAWLTGTYVTVSQTFIRREVAALRELGWDVRTFSIRRGGKDQLVGPELESEAARTFHVLEAAGRPGVAVRAHWEALRRVPGTWARMLGTALRTSVPGLKGRAYGFIYFHEAVVLAAELRRQRAVHLHNHFALGSCTVARLAAPLAGIPWSFTVHGYEDFLEPSRWGLDDKAQAADFVVCVSSFACSQMMLHSPQSAWSKFHIVHCGIEPERYRRPRRPVPDRLAFVGRLVAVKGVPVLLRALRLARRTKPTLTLSLVGDGPDRAALEAEARALGLDGAVTFLGYRNQEGVAEILAESAALVVPSFVEGIPVVLMEAMASGIPVVASGITGIPELVEDGVSGRLVPPSDEEALAKALIDVTDEGAALRMGAAGRAKVTEGFDLRTETARLARLLAWACAGGPQPSRRPEIEGSVATTRAEADRTVLDRPFGSDAERAVS